MKLVVTIKRGHTRRDSSTNGSHSLRLKGGKISRKRERSISGILRTITSKRTAKTVSIKSTMKKFCRLKKIRKLLISLLCLKKRMANPSKAKTRLAKTRLPIKILLSIPHQQAKHTKLTNENEPTIKNPK